MDKVLARKGRERQFGIGYSWNKKGVEVWPLHCLQQWLVEVVAESLQLSQKKDFKLQIS